MTINTEDLIEALSCGFHDVQYYLVVSTGEIIFISESEKERDDYDEEIYYDDSLYIGIDQIDSTEKFKCLEQFASQVNNNQVSAILKHALSNNKPFKNFKNVINSLGAERDEWFKFEHQFMTNYASEWVKEYAPHYCLT